MMYLYDPNSESGLALARALGVQTIRHTGSTFKGFGKRVLNWGCSDLPLQVRRAQVFNEEHCVDWAVNKIKAFTRMTEGGVCTVPWTTDINVAREWLEEGARVFGRTRVKGKDGEGIRECVDNLSLDGCKLYTKFIRAEKEYRINIVCQYDQEGFHNFTQACQRKVPLDGFTGHINPDIKTSSNGYGFKFVTRNIPDDVILQSRYAINALGLDFGGVDVIWDGTQAYVLEVNTAPQFTPRVIETLLPAFKELLHIE